MQIVLPILSLAISASLVGHEYYRRAALKSELRHTERELNRLRAKMPNGSKVELQEPRRSEASRHHDEHHD